MGFGFSSFWAIIVPILVQYYADIGPVLCRYWLRILSILAQYCVDIDPLLCRYWPCIVSILAQYFVLLGKDYIISTKTDLSRYRRELGLRPFYVCAPYDTHKKMFVFSGTNTLVFFSIRSSSTAMISNSFQFRSSTD